MVQRPAHLSYPNTSIEFNKQLFSEIEVDLNHVNKDDRSKFEVKDIEKALKSMVDKKTFSPAGNKVFGDESCTYYVIHDLYDGHPYKLVLCVCSDKPNTLGIITLHKENL